MARVLVVDDDPDFVKVTTSVLGTAGYEVESTGNWAQALRSLREDPPDLVLLDVLMSYILDGLDVGREMAEEPAMKDSPIIMVASTNRGRRCRLSSTDEYIPLGQWLPKPVHPDLLLSRVSEALSGS